MKKVYMPSKEELYIMQDRGMNLYKYLLIKAIESIIMENKVYKNNQYILPNIYKYLRENMYIDLSICGMYPEEIKHSIYSKDDIKLCLQLISSDFESDKSIYNLDNLSYFQNGIGLYTNAILMDKTIKTLIDKLPLMPKYRFEYKDNLLLDNIFSCNINHYMMNTPLTSLSVIEPAYILLDKNISSNDISNIINTYAKRYGISESDCNEYKNEDILTNPDKNVKRLLKCIKQRKLKK